MAQLKPLTYNLRYSVKPEIIAFLRGSEGVKSSVDICDHINSMSEALGLEKPLIRSDVRKIINEIRSLAEAPICSNSKGYFISYSKEEIFKTVRSLEERTESIKNASDGLRRMLNGHYSLYDF